jgi:hypothetical protein
VKETALLITPKNGDVVVTASSNTEFTIGRATAKGPMTIIVTMSESSREDSLTLACEFVRRDRYVLFFSGPAGGYERIPCARLRAPLTPESTRDVFAFERFRV